MKGKTFVITAAIGLALSSVAFAGGKADSGSSKDAAATSAKNANLNVLVIHWDETRKRVLEEYYKPHTAEKFPGWRVSFDTGAVDSNTYIAQLKTYLVAEQLPDIFFMQGSQMAEPFLRANALVPLNKYLEKEWLAKFLNDKPLTPYSDGNVYALEAGFDPLFTQILYYNKRIFAENGVKPPQTWNELLTVIEQFKKKGITPITIDGKTISSPIALYEMLVYAEDPRAMERVAADPRRISDPVFLNAAKRLQQLVKIGAFQKGFLLSDWPQAEADFKAERSAMQFAVTWSLGPYLKDPAVEKFLDYLPYPKVDESLDLSKTFALQYDPMLGFSISSKTKDVKATVDYLKFLVEENALFYVQELKSPVLFDPGKKIEGMHPLMERYFQAISKPDYAYQWIAFQLNADGIGNVIMSSQKLMALDTTPEEFVEILGQALQ